MRQIYLIPNIITAFGLSCGLFVVFKVNLSMPGAGAYELLYSSALLLLLAAFADLLDGAVARIIHAESEFGVMFDSLADTISFGVAPSVLFLKSLSLEHASGLSFFAVVGAMLYTICGVLRLVRFNVRAQEVKSDKIAMLAYKKNFTGLPIPAAAAGAVSVNLFINSIFFKEWFTEMPHMTKTIVLTCIMIVIGYLMICKWKFPSLKTLRVRVPSFHLILFTVILAIFILYGIFYYLPIVLVIGSVGYIVTGCVLRIARLIAGKKSKTLADFEPESDEKD
ncbi:CDP-alcohol phosphatidyltransferase family protein [Simkania negevensis]|uniref:CDP-diacylglycerol--serine O-phosphatidyltransferase n=1 Tax=Simkania negevensis (strain ATCC VR-1471 / DSM 27360 / Z) TaxID=331113 RepID=F8L9J4_SIMNZ|nr:CDP-alcohol phosphatidyltransferase family protein [Simkania negevensis]CCB89531.1 cDP-diacylglycerol--serine O-phosphatidyltransferase [Simkania negevensis Z]